MIWNDDILFLHVPKTGGISVTDFLLSGLRGEVHYTAAEPVRGHAEAVFHPGRRHETLADAEAHLNRSGRSVHDFAEIFAVMRNPYDLEVSRYHYLRKGHEVDRGTAQDLAMAGDYRAYLASAPFFGSFPPRLDRFFRLGRVIPDAMRVLRFERLEDDLNERIGPHLADGATRLPHKNRSKHDDWWTYYDAECEQLCYERHRWFFDLGFYPRRGDFPASP